MPFRPGRYIIKPLDNPDLAVDYGKLDTPDRTYVTEITEDPAYYLWELTPDSYSNYFFVSSVRNPGKFLAAHLDGQGVVAGPRSSIQVIREKSFTDREVYSLRGQWRGGTYGASDWYVVNDKKLDIITSHQAPTSQAESVYWELVEL